MLFSLLHQLFLLIAVLRSIILQIIFDMIGLKSSMEKEMATHSSVLAWRIPGPGEPGGLRSMGSHRVGHDWSNLAVAAAASLPYYLFAVFVSLCFPSLSFLAFCELLDYFFRIPLWLLMTLNICLYIVFLVVILDVIIYICKLLTVY